MLEVGGSVVAGEFGGQGAYPGEFAAGEAVQAEPEQVLGLVGVVDEVLELVEDVSVQESDEQPVGVQCVGGAEPARMSSSRTFSRGRTVAGGRCPRALASGRVTSSGTALG